MKHEPLVLLTIAVLTSCQSGEVVRFDDSPANIGVGPGSGRGGASGLTGAGASGGSSSSSGGSGLPCDVQSLLATRCQTCHGTRPLAGVPTSLVTYADLSAPS